MGFVEVAGVDHEDAVDGSVGPALVDVARRHPPLSRPQPPHRIAWPKRDIDIRVEYDIASRMRQGLESRRFGLSRDVCDAPCKYRQQCNEAGGEECMAHAGCSIH